MNEMTSPRVENDRLDLPGKKPPRVYLGGEGVLGRGGGCVLRKLGRRAGNCVRKRGSSTVEGVREKGVTHVRCEKNPDLAPREKSALQLFG